MGTNGQTLATTVALRWRGTRVCCGRPCRFVLPTWPWESSVNPRTTILSSRGERVAWSFGRDCGLWGGRGCCMPLRSSPGGSWPTHPPPRQSGGHWATSFCRLQGDFCPLSPKRCCLSDTEGEYAFEWETLGRDVPDDVSCR